MPTSNQHTPGPWSRKFHNRVTPPNDVDGTKSIAHIYDTKNPAEYIANIQVITAAPDMLEALQLLDADWTSEWPDGPDTEFNGRSGITFAESTLAIWRAARAAISKATGV